jgi:hypothetical protein
MAPREEVLKCASGTESHIKCAFWRAVRETEDWWGERHEIIVAIGVGRALAKVWRVRSRDHTVKLPVEWDYADTALALRLH